jgi:hypothetical protein
MGSRSLIFGILFFFVLQGAGLARNGPPAPRPLYFAELWNNVAYYDTNLEKKGFASFLGRFEGKLGLNLFNSPLQVYGVYYATVSQSEDYWNNPVFYGAGARFKPMENYGGSGWADEWLRDVKIFAESLAARYLKDEASAEASGLADKDTRYGIDVWHEWNLDRADESVPWGEIWLNLSSRKTNFGWESGGFNEWVLYFQPKFGRHLGSGVQAYLRADVTMSGKEGPDYYFLNVADYGIGIRFEPWRQDGTENDLLRKFKMFAEVLAVSYLKDKPADPNKEVSTDARFGIDFSFGR